MSESSTTGQPAAISGIEAMRGVGAGQAKGFWADAWGRVVARFGARMALGWIGTVAFFAVFAPVLASAHPLLRRNTETGDWDSPLWQSLTAVDLVMLAGGLFAVPWVFMPASLAKQLGVPGRSTRLGLLFLAAMQAGFTVVAAGAVSAWSRGLDSAAWIRELGRGEYFPWLASAAMGAVAIAAAVVIAGGQRVRLALIALTAVIAVTAGASRWSDTLVNFDTYDSQEASGKYSMVYTVVPFSPDFGRSDLHVKPPLAKVGEVAP